VPEELAPRQVAVSVSDMARLVGLGRSRFHQLIKEGVFPAPCQCPETGRPYYDYAGQLTCLEVRRTHRGINGRTVMFYARQFGRAEDMKLKSRPKPLGAQSSSARKKKPTPPPAGPSTLDILVESLKQLGMSTVTKAEATDAFNACFGEGDQKLSDEAALLAVFRYLSRQNSGGNHGR
jgi:hypothetical protein